MRRIYRSAVLLSLAGLLVPVPMMMLAVLTGLVQAYIFAILASVFIGAAVSEGRPSPQPASPAME